MAYASISKRTQKPGLSIDIDQDTDVGDVGTVNIWFGESSEIYLSLTIAEAEELATRLLEELREQALNPPTTDELEV